jgi:hypothetical protein
LRPELYTHFIETGRFNPVKDFTHNFTATSYKSVHAPDKLVDPDYGAKVLNSSLPYCPPYLQAELDDNVLPINKSKILSLPQKSKNSTEKRAPKETIEPRVVKSDIKNVKSSKLEQLIETRDEIENAISNARKRLITEGAQVGGLLEDLRKEKVEIEKEIEAEELVISRG